MKSKYHNITLISNAVCLIMSIWFSYKHFFNNPGKGIDEIFYSLSLFSLFSFFALKASGYMAQDKQLANRWLFAGIAYITLSTIFIEFQLLSYASFATVIILTFFVVALILKKHLKSYMVLDGAMYIGLILAILPVYSFLTLILSLIISSLKQ